MSQRNPMNERYQTDKVKGQTKKSAASAKPKSKAAASVYVRSTKKTPQEKKAIRKQERARAAEFDRKYYNPPTKEYKDLRRLWWILLIAAIILTVISFFGQGYMSPTMTMVTLVAAYGCIIAALYVDFSKIRKVRRRYQAEMQKKHPKAVKNKATAVEIPEPELPKKGFMSRFKKDEAKSEEPKSQKNAKAEEKEDVVPDHAKPIAEVKAEHEAAKAEKKEAEQN